MNEKRKGLGKLLPALLIITFIGTGVVTLIHVFDEQVADTPDPSSFYYPTLDGWSTGITDILAFEDFESNGLLDLVVNDVNGDCDWYGLIKDVAPSASDTHIALSDLNGQSVLDSEFLYWAVKPQSTNVSQCRLDYNVSIS